MSDNPQDAATLRARVADHEAAKGAAEARRAEMIAGRQDALVNLTDLEMEHFDAELARIVRSVERADAHLGLLRPALASAADREAEAEGEARRAAENASFADVHNGMMAAFAGSPERARSAALGALTARGPEIAYSSTIFDLPPPPVQVHVDLEQWHRDREERLRAEGASTSSVPRSAPTSADFGRPHPSLSI